jgi:hypothetical protein
MRLRRALPVLRLLVSATAAAHDERPRAKAATPSVRSAPTGGRFPVVTAR